MAKQDVIQRAKERYSDAREAMRDNHERMAEDMEFSNPADPKQWNPKTLKEREGRPTMVFDQTNQYVNQVVNNGRQNTPSIQTVPVDDRGDVLVSQELNGIFRHIEYASRAGIAYDTSLDNSARVGLGWLRVVPKVVNAELNYQEPRILGVNDPLSCCLDGDSVEFDGSDAMYGFAETTYSERAFKRKWPKAATTSFGDSDGWFSRQGIRVAEYFDVVETKRNQIAVEMPDGRSMTLGEDEYWKLSKQIGYQPQVLDTFEAVDREVKWSIVSGCEVLEEETVFPSKWIGLVPVYGTVVWVRGKRYVCGLVRRLMDGQRFHNYEMSSLSETVLAQPKAPFVAPGRAIEGYEKHWEELNSGNPSYLPYNDIDDEGNPVPPPIRLSPPTFPVAFAQGAQLGTLEMQASVGMYKSTLGQQSNSVSGRAKMADRQEGDQATFHYPDNQRRSMEQVGRIVIDMLGRLIDTPRLIQSLSLQDDKVSTIRVNPELAEPVRKEAGKVVEINLRTGEYDVRVKVGPSYTTMREELQDRLTALGQTNPALAAALAPILVKMADLPEADRVARVALSLLPPEVQAAYNEDETSDVPPAIKAQMKGMQDQLQQAAQLVQKLAGELDAANAAAASTQAKDQAELVLKGEDLKIRQQAQAVDAFNAETNRMKVAAEIQRTSAEALNQQAQATQAQAELSGQVQSLLSAIAALVDQQQATVATVQSTQEGIGTLAEQQAQTEGAVVALAEAVEAATRPRRVEIVRDESGRAVGAVSTTEGTLS